MRGAVTFANGSDTYVVDELGYQNVAAKTKPKQKPKPSTQGVLAASKKVVEKAKPAKQIASLRWHARHSWHGCRTRRWTTSLRL